MSCVVVTMEINRKLIKKSPDLPFSVRPDHKVAVRVHVALVNTLILKQISTHNASPLIRRYTIQTGSSERDLLFVAIVALFKSSKTAPALQEVTVSRNSL